MANELVKLETLKDEFKGIAKLYLENLGDTSPESLKKFQDTLGDFAYYVTPENVENITKMRKANFLNAMYRVSKTGALFSQKQASLLPFEIKKKEKRGDSIVEISTGEYDAVLVIDINYQKQMIQALPNCKKFFTGEVYEGVQPILNLTTGNYEFIGVNDCTKQTIGYYAAFITNDGVLYDCFMTNKEIITRAESNPKVKKENYKEVKGNIHMEKIVIRNLYKEIPKLNEALKAIDSLEAHEIEITEHEDVTDQPKVNALEEAKKEIAVSATLTNEPVANQEAQPEATQNSAVKFF